MNVVDAAIQAKQNENTRKDYEFRKDYSINDYYRDRQKEEEDRKKTVESRRVTLTLKEKRFDQVLQDVKGEYQPYVTSDNRLEFYNHDKPGNPVDMKWISLGIPYQNITDGMLIHDPFLKPYYFRIQVIE